MRGGFPGVDDNNKPGDVTVYLDSEDIETDLKKIETNGGKTILGNPSST
jgi:predicted enzyme related to lactoylglutathione lyase